MHSRERRRRTALQKRGGMLLVALVVALGGCKAVEQESANSPAPTSEASAEPGITRCSDIEDGTPPPDVEVDTVLYREHGRLTFTYLVPGTGQDRSLTIEYETDTDCRANPRLNRLIEHVLNAG